MKSLSVLGWSIGGLLFVFAATICEAELSLDLPRSEKSRIAVPPPTQEDASPNADPEEATGLKPTQPEPLRLALDLTDGSHIIGIPSIKSVSVQTEYAKIDIPLTKIQSIKMADGNETGSFVLVNGDRLKGVVDFGGMQLTTLFGRVSPQVAHILNVTVTRGGTRSGLVLHYSFDRDEGARVVDESRNNHDGTAHSVGYVDSIKGKGIRTTSSSTYVICNSPDLSCDGWKQLTVTTWVKVSKFATYGRILNRGNINKAGGFGLAVGGTYGGKPQNATFGVNLGDGKRVAVTLKRFAELNTWYHIAGVYDGRTVKYYINGEVAGSTDVPDKARNSVIKEEPGVDLMVGKCSGRRSWRDTHINGIIDEVMVFKRALSKAEIARLYQKHAPDM